MGSLVSDFRFVIRSLRKSPLFAVVAVVSLALGIGANTAIFGLLDQVLLRSLPVKDPQQLVQLTWKGHFSGSAWTDHSPFSYPAYQQVRDTSSAVFSGVAADYATQADFGSHGTAERAFTALVSANYFSVFGVAPALGRVFSPEMDRAPGAAPYVVLSYGYWERRFGGNGSVLNSTVDLNGHPFTVIGIAARGFKGSDVANSADVFVPLAMRNIVLPTWSGTDERTTIWLHLFARLKGGVSVKTAEAATLAIYRRSQREDLQVMPEVTPQFEKTYLGNTLALEDASRGLSRVRDEFSTALLILMTMVGTLLLIACGNVANLLVARAAARQREIAIRLSLGATRSAVVRLVLMESSLLASAGAAIGILIAWWTSSALLRLLPFNEARQSFSPIPDGRMLLFTMVISIVTALIFGAIPAWQTASPSVAPILKNEAASVVGGARVVLRKGLVAGQITLSLLMLVGTGLFARSLYQLMSVSPGVATRHILTFSVDPSLANYNLQKTMQAFTILQERLSELPGVESVSGSANPILAKAEWINSTRVEGYNASPSENNDQNVNALLPDFFRTLSTALVSGRDFSRRDVLGAPKVAIVNQAFVNRFFPGQSPLGRHIGFGSSRTAKLDMEIVGVVKTTKGSDLKEKPTRYVYVPLLQMEQANSITFYIRAAGDVTSISEAAQRTVRQFDPRLPIYDMKTLDVQIQETHYVDRLVFLLSAGFGVLATLLAAFGLYGVMAFVVARRTRELGVRMALGAQQSTVLRMVLREVLLLTGIGIAAALPLAFGLGRLMESQLFQVKGSDPITMLSATMLLATVAVCAGFVPAYRASKIDPMRALRWE